MSLQTTSNNQTRDRARALGRAAESGDAALVGELLAGGVPADARLEGGATALMRAAARGYSDVARVLLDAGADANACRADGFSPLVLAVFFGHEEVVRLLLERGAHASARTRLGVTARGWAESRGFAAISELWKNAPETPVPPAEASRPREPAPERSAAARALPVEIHTESREAKEAAWPPRAATAHAPQSEEHQSFKPQTFEPQFSTPARGFLGSWQASVGVFLLVAACGVAAFAIWQNTRGTAGGERAPTPAAAPAPQAAQPLTVPPPAADLAAQPTPTPALDAQGDALMPGVPIIIQPYPSDQPAPVPPDVASPGAGVSTSDPAVVSESDAPAAETGPRREARDARDAGRTADTPAGRRDDERRADDERADESPRRDRSPDAEIHSPPAPAPSPTPRSRVIQWPP
jgi:hypothetical protein